MAKRELTPVVDPASVPGAVKTLAPVKMAPQLTTWIKAAPEGDQWLHEIVGQFEIYHAGRARRQAKTDVIFFVMSEETPTDEEIRQKMEKLGNIALDELRKRRVTEKEMQKVLNPKKPRKPK